jgi:hypothetical protein
MSVSSKKWRLFITESNGTSFCSAGDYWEIYNKNGAFLNDAIAVISSSNDHSSYPASNLLLSSTVYQRFSNNTMPCWIELEFSFTQTIAALFIRTGSVTISSAMFKAFSLQYDSSGDGDWIDYYSQSDLIWSDYLTKYFVIESSPFDSYGMTTNLALEVVLGTSTPAEARITNQLYEVAIAEGTAHRAANVSGQIAEIILSGSSTGFSRISYQEIEVGIPVSTEIRASWQVIEVAWKENLESRVTAVCIEACCKDLITVVQATQHVVEAIIKSTANARTSGQAIEIALLTSSSNANITEQIIEVGLSGNSESLARVTDVCIEAICFYFRLVRSTIEIWRNTPNTVVWSGGIIEHEGVFYRVEPGYYVLPEFGVEYYIYFDPDYPTTLQVSDNYEEILLTKKFIQSVQSDGIQLIYGDGEETPISFPINDANIITWQAGKIGYNGVIYEINAGYFAFPQANVAYYIYFSPDHPNDLQVASESEFILGNNAILAIVMLYQVDGVSEILIENRVAEKPCNPIIGAYIGTLEVTDMFIGEQKIIYPNGIDPCGWLVMGSDCCTIIARKLTHSNDVQAWDLRPYRFSGPMQKDAKWQLFEFTGTDYERGDVDPSTGELIGLPDEFRSYYAYDGYMVLVVCTGMKFEAPYWDDVYKKAMDYIPTWTSDGIFCGERQIIT